MNAGQLPLLPALSSSFPERRLPPRPQPPVSTSLRCPPARGLGRAASGVQPASCHLREADPPPSCHRQLRPGGRAKGVQRSRVSQTAGKQGCWTSRLTSPPRLSPGTEPGACAVAASRRAPAASGRCWAIASLQPLVGLSGPPPPRHTAGTQPYLLGVGGDGAGHQTLQVAAEADPLHGDDGFLREHRPAEEQGAKG